MKLLRKIRMQLIASGKVKSYMVYALGEIVLIVIGISIAWKINEWNDIRKNNISEQKIYSNLNEELHTNFGILNGLIDEYPQTITYLENTLNYVGQNPETLSEGAKDTIVNLANKKVNLLDGVINSIVNTNKFEFMENDNLKDLIITFPNKITEFKEQEAKIKMIVENKLKPVLESHVSLLDKFSPSTSKFTQLQTSRNRSDYGALLASRIYQNGLVDRLMQTKIQLDNAKRLRSKTKLLIKSLEDELD
ncbi:conserved hypothetical protein [Formosa agariphila KMM 3901]|uniref:Uncharacterized protein n=1 Tax=Formosa agariphila (strain DSM 15362 / KCTC 12365 / LMG 23005 / KMM 3901 / M-2Alg 35-1) TaxID=1347342 RepID=T2KLE9_FORAG|nr:hypothetical protein [Formosa agariphila]CDF79261.1 conserved hypothetical protein [Formosa agariphila KMM 3901]